MSAQEATTPVPERLLDHQHELDLSSTELVVLVHLLRYADASGVSRPDVPRIAKAMDLEAQSVLRQFSALEKLGLIERTTEGYALDRLVTKLDRLTAG